MKPACHLPIFSFTVLYSSKNGGRLCNKFRFGCRNEQISLGAKEKNHFTNRDLEGNFAKIRLQKS